MRAIGPDGGVMESRLQKSSNLPATPKPPQAYGNPEDQKARASEMASRNVQGTAGGSEPGKGNQVDTIA